MLKVQIEYKGIDIMKFVMAIVVVAIHARPEMYFSSSAIRRIFEGVYSIAVPYFFMASGFLLFRKISLPMTEVGEKRIKNYIVRMCRLYLVWTLMYLPLTIYGFYIDGVSPLKAAAVFFRNVLLVGENYMSWPLWYLLALIVAVVIIYVMLKLKMSKNWIVVVSILMAFVGVGLDYCKDNNILKPITDLYFSNFLKTRNGFFVGFLFVTLGMFCASLNEYRNSLWKILLSLLVGLVGMAYSIPLSYAIVTFVVFILSISQWCEEVNTKCSTKLRQLSTIVYFIHMLAISALVLFLNYDYGAALFVISVSVSFVVGIVLMRYKSNKIFRFLFF